MKIRFAVVATAALACLPALAQTNIPINAATNMTIGGLIAMGVKNSETSNGNAPATINGVANPFYNRVTANEIGLFDNTSRLWFTSTSKVADGWTVFMRIESRIPMNVRPGDPLLPNTVVGANNATATGVNLATNGASGWGDGDTWAGVGTPWGNFYGGHMHLYVTDPVSAGYLAPTLESPGEGYRVWDVQGLGVFNILNTYFTGRQDGNGALTKQNTLSITRSRNVLKWDSPLLKPDASSFLTFSLAWSKNAAGAQNAWKSVADGTTYEGGQTIFAKALYNGHGVSALFTYVDQKFQGVLASAANTELKAARLGVSYKVNGFKAGVLYDNTSMVNGGTTGATPVIVGDSGRTAFQVPISYHWGDHGVYATYTVAGKTASLDNTGGKQVTLAYDYAMTKRAFIGIQYTTINNDSRVNYQGFLNGFAAFGNSSQLQGEAWRQISLSLNYWF